MASRTKIFWLAAGLAAAVATTAFAQSRLLGRGRDRGGFRGGSSLAQRQGGNGAAANGAAADGSGGGSGTPVASAAGVDEAAESEKAPALNFSEAPLDLVLDTYSKLVDRTVLKDPNTPDATITLQSRPGQTLTKEEQVEAIEVKLEMHGIHMEDYGTKFVRALPRDKARTDGIPFVEEDAELEESGRVVSTMITFKNIPIDEAQKALEGLKSQRGQLLIYERIGKINVTDTQMNILRMRQLRNEIDIATPINENVFVRQIKNASAADIKTALEQIVQESQKELEKAGKAAQTAQPGGNDRVRPLASTPGGTLLRRPGANQPQQPAAPANVESLVTNVSDADRGMIRGKVLIMSDERSNKLIVVTAKTNMDFFDKVIEQLDVETTPDTVVKVYRLKYAEAEDVSDMINDLIGNTQKSGQRENQNAAARNGSGGNLTRGGQQQRGGSNTPANQRSGEAKAGELTKDNTTVLADKRINGLVVMTQKELVPTLEAIIESMDVKLSQVLIETAIVEVTLGDELKTGIDWLQRGRQRGYVQQTRDGQPLYYGMDEDGNINRNVRLWSGQTMTYTGSGEDAEEIKYTASSIPAMVSGIIRDGMVNNNSYMLGGGGGTGASLLGTMMAAGTNVVDGAMWGGANPIGSGLNYLLKSDKLNLAAVVQAAKDDSRSKYVASPIVMTVDNKEATIEATQMRYLLKGYTYSGSTYNGTTVPDYEQKEIGLTIKVTPKINPNGTVMLKVEEEYSQVGANQSIQANVGGATTSTVSVPTTITRKMSADITLDNMQTVVLGGLTEAHTSTSETGIPILKDIPWIGKWLFSSTTDSEDRKELLVFMTPYVLNDAEAAQAEARRRKNALSDSRPWANNGNWSASALADPMPKKEMLRRLKEEAARQDEDRANRIAAEKWKLERAKELEKMSSAERKFWLEQRRDQLETDEEKEAFDKAVEDDLTQDELADLAQSIRAERLKKAEAQIDDNATSEREKAAPAEPAPAEPAPVEPTPAEPTAPAEPASLLSTLVTPAEPEAK